MTKEVKEVLKRYNGNARAVKITKSKKSSLSIDKICNTIKLSKGLTIERLMNEVR